MNFFSSLRKKVATFLAPSDPNRIVFDSELLRKLQSLIQQLAKKQKRNKEANVLLAELLKPLQALTWEYTDTRGNLLARQHLLQLCELMLSALAHVAPAERFNYYKGVGYLMRRLEYGGELVRKNTEPSGEEIAICIQYRGVLRIALATTVLVLEGRPMTAPATQDAGPLVDQTPAVLQAYCAQLLAVLAFRVPYLMDHILRLGLAISPEDIDEVHADQKFVMEQLDQQTQNERFAEDKSRKEILSTIGGDRHAGISLSGKSDASKYYLQPFSEVGLSLSDAECAKCPELFGWNQFHARLRKMDTDKEKLEKILEGNLDWVTKSLHRGSSIFHLFFKYWLEHVSLCQDAAGVVPHLPFRDIPPYRSLVRAFLIAFAEAGERGRSMTDCAVALIAAEPAITTFLFKALFISTDASNCNAVLDSLMQVEFWFKQLKQDGNVLPEDFDYDFMITGFDRILQMEHHVVTARLLSLVYNFSSVFAGEGRLKLFGGLLIQKYGYMLFLSWDVNTRSIFHQILIFRLLRHTRKELQGAPRDNKEFGEDRILFSKQEAMLRAIKAQCDPKDGQKKEIHFDDHWSAYYEKAMEDWNEFYGVYLESPFDHRLQVLQKASQAVKG